MVAANRVRRGGVGGFFAREHFEVIVELVDTVEVIETVAAVEVGAPPTPERAAPRRRRGRGRAKVAESTESTEIAEVAAVEINESVGPSGHAGATSILDLAEAVNGTERARQTKRAHPKPARAGVTGGSNTLVDLTDTDPNPVADPGASDGERFVQILDRIAREVDAHRTDGHRSDAHDRPLAATLDAPQWTPEPWTPEQWTDDDEIAVVAQPPRVGHAAVDLVVDTGREPLRAASSTVQATPFVAPRVRRNRDVDIIERPENLLARLGLPPRYIPRGVDDSHLRGALIESLAQLPVAAPLPNANGVVVAVVGVGAQPVLLARMLATERGLDPDNLVLATARELGSGIPSWLQITDAATAEERRRSWRRRGHATFVAVSIPSLTDGHAWAKAMLDHLEPTQTWGIVDATWKVDDTEAWAGRLGGLDVVAVEHLADTASPASPIQLQIPIGRLDGRPATPLRWAEILTERMAER